MTLRAVVLASFAAVGCGSCSSTPSTEGSPGPEVPEVTAAGDPAAIGDPRCVAYTSCGCWRGCVRVQEHRSADGAVFRVLDGDGAGADLVFREDCYEDRCFQVCGEDSPDARCDPGTYAEQTPCTGACAPSEAPYHCETSADGCRRVDHPGRTGSD